jgi:hypothetical protein
MAASSCEISNQFLNILIKLKDTFYFEPKPIIEGYIRSLSIKHGSAPGSGYIESFNGKMRDELLNA